MRKNQRKIREVRKNSHELFLEAKRRFQYKPNPKRSQFRASDVIHSPECSSVTENNKQQHSNDFSWLDKMVNGFEFNSKQLQENVTKTNIVVRQPKAGYFAKRRTVLGEKSLNKTNMSLSKPIIKRSLEKVSGQHLKKKLHKAVITHKSTKNIQSHKFEDKDIQDDDNADEECPKLFATKRESFQTEDKTDDLCTMMKNISTRPLDVDVTILKVEEPSRNRFIQIKNLHENIESVIHPTPEKSPEKLKEKRPETCILGKIKRNNLKHQPSQKADEPKKKPNMSLSLIEVQNRRQYQSNQSTKCIQKSGNLTYFRETIHEQEQERSCETSGRLEEKFRQIFVELDTKKLGYIDRMNYYGDSINDEIRYLIGPILSKIKYQEKRFTLQTFIEQGKRIISALETHQVSKLLRCSVINRLFFLDTKRSQRNQNSNTSATHTRNSHSTIIKSCNKNSYGEGGNRTHNRHMSVAQANYEAVHENTPEHKTYEKTPEIFINGLECQISSDINRDPYLRLSTSKSLQKLSVQYSTAKESKTIERWRAASTQEPSAEQIIRQAYLTRHDTSQLIKSQEISEPCKTAILQPNPPLFISQNIQKHNIEREQFNRIDILNERLTKYIMENHLRAANRSGQFDNITLEFAELRKHLRE